MPQPKPAKKLASKLLVRRRVPYDAAKGAAAMSAKWVYDDFFADRRAAVCRATDPEAFAADPGRFVYTADHCHAKRARGAKGADGRQRRLASADSSDKRGVSTDDTFACLRRGSFTSWARCVGSGMTTSRSRQHVT